MNPAVVTVCTWPTYKPDSKLLMEGRLIGEENEIGVSSVIGGLVTGRTLNGHAFQNPPVEYARGYPRPQNPNPPLNGNLDPLHPPYGRNPDPARGYPRPQNGDNPPLRNPDPARGFPRPPVPFNHPLDAPLDAPHDHYEEPSPPPPPGGECWAVVFAPDGSRLAWSCGYRKVVILPWNRYKNCLLSQDSLDPRGVPLSAERVNLDAGFPVTSLAFGTGIPEQELKVKRDYWIRFDYTKDLILASGHANGRIRIWDPYNGKLLLELTDHTKPVTDLAFAPDGSLRLSSASRDGTIKVWDMSDDGNMFKTLREHAAPVRALAWSPDAAMLVSAGDKQKVLLWDMVGYKLARRLSGHFNTVLSCCFSPDGALVATASRDTRVIVWDPNTGTQLRVFHHLLPPPGVIYMSGANSSAAFDVSISPTGVHLVSICSDGFLRFWDLTTDSDQPVSEGRVLQGDTMLTCTFSPLGGAVCVGHESGSLLFYSAPTHIPSLLHLSRLSLRKAVSSPSSLPLLPLPPALLPYLTYRRL